MDESIPINIIILIILILLSAFFSATETAFSSLNKIRLKNYANSGDKRAIKALKISENFDAALSAVLIGNNIVNIAAASIGTVTFVSWLGSTGVGISTIVLTIVILIFGEVMPKSIAKENPENFALAVAGVLDILIKVFTPLIWLLMKIKKVFTPKSKQKNQQPTLTEEELKFIIEEIEDEGVLNEHESELVQSALEFNDTTVSEVLTPRVDVVAIDIAESPEKIKDIFFKKGFSRIPVYEKTIDNIIGIINEKDFLREYIKNKDVDVKPLLQQTIFVPPKKHIAELLKEIQREKIHIAVVTDQYGGTLGIVTLEDVLEELVGEIWDESDEVVHQITKLSPTSYRVNAEINVYDMFEYLELDGIEYEGQSQSVGGWALEMFEKIPKKNDSFTYKNLLFIVEGVIDQRITTFIVKINK